MTMYRVIFNVSQKEVFSLLERNPGHEASIVAVSEPTPNPNVSGYSRHQNTDSESIYKPERTVVRRKRRTKAQIEADALARAAE